MKPIEMLNEKLDEISYAYRRAYRNKCDDETMEELTNRYNQYFFAIQLLNSFDEIPYRFSKLIYRKNNRNVYYLGQKKMYIEMHKNAPKKNVIQKDMFV
jgi:hypothetical protein